MKKFFILSTMFMFIATSAFAYEAGESRLSAKIGGGFSGGTAKAISGRDCSLVLSGGYDYNLVKDPTVDFRGAWQIGAGYEYMISTDLSLATGLTYASKPFTVLYEKKLPELYDFKINFEFAYLVVPVGINYYFNYFMIGGGLYYGFLVKDDVTTEYGSTTSDIKLDNTSNDYGWYLDFGLKFDISETDAIMLTCNYQRGLGKVYEGKDDMVQDVTSTAVLFNLSYTTRL